MPLPLHPPLSFLLCIALPNRPDLLLHPVRAIAPAQGVIVCRNLLQALVLLCQPVKGGVQRAIPLLEPVITIVQPVKAVYKVKILVIERAQDIDNSLMILTPFLILPNWKVLD